MGRGKTGIKESVHDSDEKEGEVMKDYSGNNRFKIQVVDNKGARFNDLSDAEGYWRKSGSYTENILGRGADSCYAAEFTGDKDISESGDNPLLPGFAAELKVIQKCTDCSFFI